MTLMIFEMKRCRMSLAVWATSISLLLLICLVIFPDMKDQVNELNAAFSSMGGFTEAFGMDRLNFGDLMGFYGLECGNILGIGGAFFAAYIGVSSLACEEKDRTAEFLLTHPVSRFRIVFEKMLCIFWQILIFEYGKYSNLGNHDLCNRRDPEGKRISASSRCPVFSFRQKSRPYVLHFLPFSAEKRCRSRFMPDRYILFP